MGQRDFPVEIFRECFQVDVGRVDVIVNVVERVVSDVAIRHHHRLQTIFLRFFTDVDHVLAPDGRLVVRERQRLAAVFQGQQRHIFRGNFLRTHLVRARFRNVPVLAEKTAHVAARRAHAEDARAGQKMIQRLFLDGINLQSRRRAVSQVIKLSVLIGADKTESRLARMNVAVARAKIAVNSAVRFRFPPARFVEFPRFLEDLQFFHGPSSQIPLYLHSKFREDATEALYEKFTVDS